VKFGRICCNQMEGQQPLELLITEECMAEQQPRKAGEYERPATRASRSTALIIGIIAVLVVIILAVLFLR
jgi:hypothetical protein